MMRFEKKKFKRLVMFIRDYRISVPLGEQFRGIKDTLFGWAIIAFCAVISEPILDPLVLEISFVVRYFFGALAILLNIAFDGLLKGNILKGLKGLLITQNTDKELNGAHLSVKQRIFAIYLRSLLATGGYIALSIAQVYFGAIDNSEIFGADALIFVLLCSWILGERRNLKEWIGILSACSGVLFIIFIDVINYKWINGLISGMSGLYSAVTFSIIFFITTIIVRHDTPKRIVFHQCFTGVVLSLSAFFINLFVEFYLKNDFSFPHLSMDMLKTSSILGILYATALYRFLRAFLFTNPVVIAVLGYSFLIFTLFFDLFFKGISIDFKGIVSFILISSGCALLLREEYKRNKTEMEGLQPVYQFGDSSQSELSQHMGLENNSLKQTFKSLADQFYSGLLDRYSYISRRHEFNKLLLEYSIQIRDSEIESIKIEPEHVIFTFSPLKIELETDGAARSAPFEVLNFGSYESEDELLAYALVHNGDTILDIGSNIGWYTINFAKRCPLAKIYAFEPIPATYELLQKNVRRNKVKNCVLLNYGISDKEEEKFLYYFPGGSAIASIENLINHKKAKKIKCHLKPLDGVIEELGFQSIEFIKCDVEGSELFVLKGAENTIKKFSPIIFIEICEEWSQKCGYRSTDITDLLLSWGYVFFEAHKGKLQERKIIHSIDNGRYNYFFLHSNKHKLLIDKFSI